MKSRSERIPIYVGFEKRVTVRDAAQIGYLFAYIFVESGSTRFAAVLSSGSERLRCEMILMIFQDHQ